MDRPLMHHAGGFKAALSRSGRLSGIGVSAARPMPIWSAAIITSLTRLTATSKVQFLWIR